MAFKTLLRQRQDVRKSTVYDDTIVPGQVAFEASQLSLEGDLNATRSAIRRILHTVGGNWWDSATRGIDDIETALTNAETKSQLHRAQLLADVVVGVADNFAVLSVVGLETPTETAAVGAVTTSGAVVAAHGGVFGTNDLTAVAGQNALRPKNLVTIVDGATGDPILSSNGKRIHGLLQSEIATDGHTFNDTLQQVQISFVETNATNDALVATAALDIQGKTINYSYVRRTQTKNTPEDAYIGESAWLDQSAAVDVTRANAYTNQGATVVSQVLDATLDISAGKFWEIGDALSATLFKVLEGSGVGATQVELGAAVDTFLSSAVANNFLNGGSFDTAGTPIQVAEVAGTLERAANLTVYASGLGELFLHDSNIAGEATWAQAGVKLSETSAEVAAYETAFGGEVSLMNAIVAANNASHSAPTRATVTADTAANINVGGTAGGANLDAQLPDLSVGVFTANHMLWLNGELLWPGANAVANADYYPGTSLVLGQIMLEDSVEIGDVLQVIAL